MSVKPIVAVNDILLYSLDDRTTEVSARTVNANNDSKVSDSSAKFWFYYAENDISIDELKKKIGLYRAALVSFG